MCGSGEWVAAEVCELVAVTVCGEFVAVTVICAITDEVCGEFVAVTVVGAITDEVCGETSSWWTTVALEPGNRLICANTQSDFSRALSSTSRAMLFFLHGAGRGWCLWVNAAARVGGCGLVVAFGSCFFARVAAIESCGVVVAVDAPLCLGVVRCIRCRFPPLPGLELLAALRRPSGGPRAAFRGPSGGSFGSGGGWSSSV